MRSLGTYKVMFSRAGGPPLSMWSVPVGSGLLWQSDQFVSDLYPEIRLDYFPPEQEPWAEVDRLRGLLGRLEWCVDQHGGGDACPICFEREPGPHGPGCELAAALHQADLTP